ncbi:MAG: neuraminidase-like domain-containing protein [Reichenbachiella sp.]|uniref:Tc toxin subunit A-related protein n=5 Tax=Reichenbachiella sp. TaxID=2184521 RepID=UPI0032640740
MKEKTIRSSDVAQAKSVITAKKASTILDASQTDSVISTGELYANFIQIYQTAKNTSTPYKDIGQKVASNSTWFISTAIKNQLFIDGWEASDLGKAGYSYETSCNAFYDSQQRMWNIWQNPNYWNDNDPSSSLSDAQKYQVAFRFMAKRNVCSSFDATSMATSQFLEIGYQMISFPGATQSPEERNSTLSIFYNSAANIRSQVVMQYMGMQDATNDGRIVPWNSLGSSYAQLPNYQTLFNQKNYMSVDENDSVLSPSAYLVDLDKSAERYVLPAIDGTDPANQRIRSRRPDVMDLVLNAANTTTEIPKLQIVNELLIKQCAQISGKTTEEVISDLAAQPYPLTAPYNYYLEQLRSSLTLQNTALSSIWQATKPSQIITASDEYKLAIALEQLTVYQGLYSQILSVPVTDDTSLMRERYGLPDGTDMLSISEVLETTFISTSDLSDILYENLSDDEIKTAAGGHQPMSQFYINGWSQSSGNDLSPLKIFYETDGDQRFEHVSVLKQDRLNRLIRLSQASGLSYTDLNWLITVFVKSYKDLKEDDALAVPELYSYLAAIKKVTSDFNSENVEVATALLGLIKDFGAQSGQTMIKQIFGSVAPVFYQQSDFTTWDLATLVSTNDYDATTTALMRGTQLSLQDLILVGQACATQFGYDATTESQITLNQDFLSALFRVSLAGRLLGLDAKTFVFLMNNLADGSYISFAGPLVTTQPTTGPLVLVGAFQAIQAFAATVADTEITSEDLMLMANAAGQQESLVPGKNDTIKAVQQIFAGIEQSILLTEANYNDWLAQEQKKLRITFSSNADYANLVADGYVDQVTSDSGSVNGGVVLIGAYQTNMENPAFSLPSAAIDDFNTMLQSYRQPQNGLINSVFEDTLDLAVNTGVGETISDWKELIASTGDTTTAANNILHLYYTLIQNTLTNEGTVIAELTADQISEQIAMLDQLNRLAILINTLTLSREELQYILEGYSLLENPEASSQFAISPTAVAQIINLHSLVQSYADSDNDLIAFLKLDTGYVENANLLAEATSWEQSQIVDVLNAWGVGSASYANADNVTLVTGMQQLFNLAAQMNITVEALLDLDNQAGAEGYDAYENVANEMTNVLYAGNQQSQSGTITNTLSITIDETYRDVLAGSLLGIMRNSGYSYYEGIRTFTDLSQYLLVDVQVTGKFTTSLVRDAISAYTTYFHRIVMGQEPALKLDTYFYENLWPWFESYRIWEANRKVFLNPENYLRPELRSEKSDAFAAFESMLNDSSPTEENVRMAFNQYLQDYEEVANLKCVASYFDESTSYMYFVGKTNTQPYHYFTRSLKLSQDVNENYTPVIWTPWKVIDATISSAYVNIISAFNTLYLFWIGFELTSTDSDGNNTFEYIIKCSYQQLNGSWSQIQEIGSAKMTGFQESVTYEDLLENHAYNLLELSTVATEDSDYILATYAYANQSTGQTITNYRIDRWLNVSDTEDDPINILLAGSDEDSDIAYAAVWNNSKPIKKGSVDAFYSTGPDLVESPFFQGYKIDGSVTSDSNTEFICLDYEAAGFNTSGNYNRLYGMWIYIDELDLKQQPYYVELYADFLGTSTAENMLYLQITSAGDLQLTQGNPNSTKNLLKVESIPQKQWIYVAISQGVIEDNKLLATLYAGKKSNNQLITIANEQAESSSESSYTLAPMSKGGICSHLTSSQNSCFYVENFIAKQQYADSTEILDYIPLMSGYKIFSNSDYTSMFDNLPLGTTVQSVATGTNAPIIMNTGLAEYLGLPYVGGLDEGGQWRFVRMTSAESAANLVDALKSGGVDNLLSVQTQLSSADSFSELQPNVDLVPINFWPNDDYLDISGANALYYWEIFCFAPWFVADTYHDAGDYSNSASWNKYIFDPARRYDSVTTVEQEYLDKDQNNSDIYWRFIGLRTYFSPSLARGVFAQPQGRLLEDQADHTLSYVAGSTSSMFSATAENHALEQYYNDPFSPHPIAYLRPMAYQKAVIMHVVKSKMDWADRLYTQASRDSILQAAILYLECNDLLGARPTEDGQFSEENAGDETTRTLNTINDQYSDGNIPEFLIGLEANLDNIIAQPTAGVVSNMPFNFIPGLYFGTPENKQMLSFWNTVQGRLKNLRNSLDINGNPLNLNLFEPSLNVMGLIAAKQKGVSLSDVIAAVLTTTAPVYRYSVLLSKAKEFAGIVSGFGQNLLTTLEKRDVQELAQLELTQQATILSMTLNLKQAQIDQLQAQLDSVTQSMIMAATRYLYFDKLIEYDFGNQSGTALSGDASGKDVLSLAVDGSASQTETLGDNEQVQVSMNFAPTVDAAKHESIGLSDLKKSEIMQIASAGVSGASAIAHMVGFYTSLTNRWTAAGWSLSSVASVLAAGAGVRGTQSSIEGTKASYKRRRQEWQLQKQLAEAEIEQIKQQYEATFYQLQGAQQDFDITKTQIDQNQVILNFYKDKFSNEDLYRWMQSYLTSTYYQAYKLALELSTQAQDALKYELGYSMTDPNVNLINTSSWDSTHEGLLAGEVLSHSLNLLDNFYLEKNFRRMEVVKTISLLDAVVGSNQTMAEYLAANGNSITLPIALADLTADYSNSYMHQVKMVTVTVPTLLGPYEDIHAILSHTDNVIYDQSGNEIRSKIGDGQKVALSTGQEDAGLFAADMGDPRYLPFESTGVCGDWTIAFTEADAAKIANISDIIVRVRYTALV